MRLSALSTLAAGFATLVQGAIMSPAAGDSWPVGTSQMIMWDTTGLTGPVDIHLVPAGATDITVIIEDIVIGTGNTGSFMWAPDKVLSITDVTIIIVDAKQVLVISEIFEIIVVTVLSTKMTTKPTMTHTTTKLSTVTKLPTLTTKATTMVLTQTVVKTTTPMSTMMSTLKLNTTTLKLSSSTLKLSTSMSVVTTKPMTTMMATSMMTTSMKMSTAMATSKMMNSTMTLKMNATSAAASAAKVTFTGGANAVGQNSLYSACAGGFVGLAVMIFL